MSIPEINRESIAEFKNNSANKRNQLSLEQKVILATLPDRYDNRKKRTVTVQNPNPLIHMTFSRILCTAMAPKRKAVIIEGLIDQLTNAELHKLCGHPEILRVVDSNVLIKAAVTKNCPILLTWLARNLQSADLDLFTAECWDRNLTAPLHTILIRSDGNNLGYLLRNEKIFREKKDLLCVLIPHFDEETISFYLTYFATTHQGEHTELEKQFLAHIYSHIMSDPIKTDQQQLEYVIRYFMQNGESIEGFHSTDMYDWCERLYPANPTFVTDLVNSYLNSTPASASLFSKALGGTMSFLDNSTLQQVIALFHEYLNTIDSLIITNKLLDFTKDAEEQTLFAWQYARGAGQDHPIRLLYTGSQLGKDGPINTTKAAEIVDQLNTTATSNIQFNKSKIEDKLSGGTCTAMTMQFLKDYREAKASSAEEALLQIAPNFKTSSEAFRTKQMAYNTIEKTGTIPGSCDFKREKMESLLKYENPNLTISNAYTPIDLTTSYAKNALHSHLYYLPDGQYIVRALHKFNPESPSLVEKYVAKQEMYGHTTLFIREKERSFYYDPATGPLELTHEDQLGLILGWQNARWDIPEVRFYQVDSCGNMEDVIQS